jgi:hypothetical protein
MQQVAEHDDEQRRTQEPAESREEGAGRHHRAGVEDLALIVVGAHSVTPRPRRIRRTTRISTAQNSTAPPRPINTQMTWLT